MGPIDGLEHLVGPRESIPIVLTDGSQVMLVVNHRTQLAGNGATINSKQGAGRRVEWDIGLDATTFLELHCSQFIGLNVQLAWKIQEFLRNIIVLMSCDVYEIGGR